jgi:outer membrane protein insertion porin family
VNLIKGLFLGALCAGSLDIYAATIKKIMVKGNSRVDSAVVSSYLRSQVGQEYDSQIINEDLKNLHASGLFQTVSLDFSGSDLVVNVKESPIVNEFTLEGVKSFPVEELKKNLGIESRQVFKKSDVARAVEIMLMGYQTKGYFNVKVVPQIIEREDNRVDLILKVDEGIPSTIQKIMFSGNKEFDDQELKSVILSEETGPFSVFQTTNVYDTSRLRVDVDKLDRFYKNNGYFNFKILPTVSEILPNYKGVYVTYQIEEGNRYSFGGFKIQNCIKQIKDTDVLAELEISTGSVYDQEELDKSLETVSDYFASKGFPYVQIEKKLTPNESTKTIEVLYVVSIIPKEFVERIEIIGNSLTRETVIRDKLLIAEGDMFNPVLIRRSLKNIRGLSLFDNVSYEKRPGSKRGSVVIVMSVSERPYFNLRGGAGWSQLRGFQGNFSLDHRNLWGTGVGGSLQTLFGSKSQSLAISSLKPLLFDGIDGKLGFVFRHTEDDEYCSYKEKSFSASPQLIFNWSEYFKILTDYTFRRYQTEMFSTKISRFNSFWGDRTENKWKSAIGITLVRDTRDNIFDPKEGGKYSAGYEYAGMGGNVKHHKVDVSAEHHFEFGRSKIVFSLFGKAGSVFSNEYVNFFERYQLGYLDFRGFEVCGVGPRDLLSDEELENRKTISKQLKKDKDDTDAHRPLGGLKFYSATAEITFPFSADLPIKMLSFMDAGSLWGLGKKKPESTDNGVKYIDEEDPNFRLSMGLGLQIDVPFLGRIVFGVATPIVKKEYDEVENFFFNIGMGK